MTWFVVGYLAITINGMICLQACHLSPHGLRGTWCGLWQQLNYRKPILPPAVARNTSRAGQ